MDKQISVVLLGAGNRANIYASASLKYPDKIRVVGIVDPDPVRNGLMREKYKVAKENCFSSVEDFIERDKLADAVINGTLDHLHVKTSIPVLKKGYDLLLEKPIAVNEAEMNSLIDVAKKYDRKVVLCHVLRYTDFYRAIKDHILGGEIGNIISVEVCEHVNYHHMAVSYVRGKWRSEKLCFAPMLLAKSCHDIDIMMWLMNGIRPVAVSSFGSDFQFGADRKPENAGSCCMADCPLVDECIFSAKANYLAAERWNQYVWKCLEKEKELSYEKKANSLKTDNPYGRCVWDFERDGNVDHQTVIVNFENGAVGSFNMIGGSVRSERNIHIVGTNGEIKGTFEDSRYVVRAMVPSSQSGYSEMEYDLNEESKGGHSGGDEMIMLDFIDYLNGHEASVSCATLESSVNGYLTAFGADKARKTHTIVNI